MRRRGRRALRQANGKRELNEEEQAGFQEEREAFWAREGFENDEEELGVGAREKSEGVSSSRRRERRCEESWSKTGPWGSAERVLGGP